jgi:phospholipid/cholesterol/gamma-HCH transport system permease protein
MAFGRPYHAGAVAEIRSESDVATAQYKLSEESGGRVVLALHGRFDAQSSAQPWAQLEQDLPRLRAKNVEVDARGIAHCDGTGLALLQFLSAGELTPGATVSVQGLKPEFQKLFEAFSADDYRKFRPPPPPRQPMAGDVGLAAMAVVRDLKEQIAFLGAVAVAMVRVIGRPRQLRWSEVVHVFELAGANALPIVSLISLLVGLIIAFEAAQPLAQFGAQIFIANMIGLLMVRELGPMMTAIVVAGRSGSAFAAELGTMKVNEELNALETMGLDPVRFLVVQRIIAGVLLAPLLTVYSMFMGVAGGVLVMLGLGFPLVAIYNQMLTGVDLHDVVVGLSKGVVFGIIVAGVGCLRGLQTAKGPSAVGASTTRAVVSSILLIIMSDAAFSIVLYFLET